MADTIALGRSKRATAGNRMRELLEKAHQQDEEDIFKEEENDEEFAAPVDKGDVFLEDFADTDDEVELEDEEAEDRAIRREERRKAKGKSKGVYNPLGASSKPKKVKFPREPSPAGPSTAKVSGNRAEHMELLDPNLDASSMAPTTLIMALRKQRREQKRLHRDQTLRSSLRASTLRTEEEILEREKAEKDNPNKKGRLAQHITGEVRVKTKMTQDELIAAALEEEERNREALRDWVRREEERRELRRVGRKRVRGPRWTWVSRTVGKLVEEVEANPARDAALRNGDSLMEPNPAPEIPQTPAEQPTPDTATSKDVAVPTPEVIGSKMPAAPVASGREPVGPINSASSTVPQKTDDSTRQAPGTTADTAEANAQYTRNYIILSQVPGGLAAELKLILGDHVEWDEIKYIPARNRPINRRPVICPFTGQQARYRHPQTMTPYANVEGYRQIQAMLQYRYMWNEKASMWFGGEQDVHAEGVEEVSGWHDAIHGGRIGGEEILEPESEDEEDHIPAATKRRIDQVDEAEPPAGVKRTKSKRGRGRGAR